MTKFIFGTNSDYLKHEQVLNRVLTRIFTLTLIVTTPFVVTMYFRSQLTNTGKIIFYIDVFAIISLIAFLLIKKISRNFKIHFYITIMFITNTIGMYHLGYFAAGKYMLLLLIVIPVIFLPLKNTLILMVIGAFSYISIAYLYSNNILNYNINIESLIKSPILWISDGLILLFLSLIVILVIGEILNAYKLEVSKMEESENILYNTIQNIPVPTAIVDKNLKVVYLNKSFEPFTGFKIEEIPDIETWNQKVYRTEVEKMDNYSIWGPDIKKVFEQKIIPPVREYYFYSKSRERKIIEIHHNIINDNLALVMFVDVTQKRKQQREIIEAIVNTEENERSRMAKELHDGLGPLVSTAKIYAHTLNSNTEDQDVKEKGKRLIELLDESITEIRSISNNISPHILRNYGLKDAMMSFIEKLIPISDIEFHLSFDDNFPLSKHYEFTIYRTLVEMINNSIKYAEAKNISIKFNNLHTHLIFTYEDDGKGFDLEEKRGSGFGLLNMESRIVNMGGSYVFKTTPGQGVKATIKINYTDNDSDSTC